MSYAGINYDYSYRDSPFNNHDRTSWLRDNFLRPRYEAPLAQKMPAFFNTQAVPAAAAASAAETLVTEAAQLFPRHEASTGRTVFGTLAPSRLLRARSEEPPVAWAKLARGLAGAASSGRCRAMAMPPPDAQKFVADVEGSIRRQVACLHGRNVDSFSSSSSFAPW